VALSLALPLAFGVSGRTRVRAGPFGRLQLRRARLTPGGPRCCTLQRPEDLPGARIALAMYKCAFRYTDASYTLPPYRYNGRLVEEHRPEPAPRKKRPNPTPEQLAARQQLAEARMKTLQRKKRTRQLIQVGGVMAAWGIDTPE
jgi:hypothetical protein